MIVCSKTATHWLFLLMAAKELMISRAETQILIGVILVSILKKTGMFIFRMLRCWLLDLALIYCLETTKRELGT